jgi:hypothetical protein
MKLLTVAEMALRELLRRKRAIAMLFLLPLALYMMVRADSVGQSVRSVFLGIGWAVSTAALFATTAGQSVEPRLWLAGYRGYQVVAGRLVALWTTGLVLALPFLVLIRFDAPDVRLGAVAVAMVLLVLVSAPFGLLVGLLLPRELEGTLLLFTVVGFQMTINQNSVTSRLAPLWGSREIGTYAIDHTDTGYVARGTLHGAVYLLVLVILVGLVVVARQRRGRHLRYAPEQEGVRA